MAKILIVDDQPDNLYVLERLLKGQKHQVLQAERGEQALQIAGQEMPDLILLDVMMPGLDGFEVVQRLRQDGSTRTIPVVLLTANAPDQRLKIQALNLGADEYLTQPINNSELLARIRALLRTKQAQDELQSVNTQLRALLDVIQAGTSSLALDDVARRLAEGAVRAASAEAASIWLLQDESFQLLAETGYPVDNAAGRRRLSLLAPPVLGDVARSREVRFGPTAELFGADHPYGTALVSAIILPLVHHGAVVGLLQLHSGRARHFTVDDVAFLSAMANTAAASIQNARLFEETDRQRLRLKAVDSEKDEFISIITHELKNPLASIKGYAGLLTRRVRKEDALSGALKGLHVIEQQVNRMTTLLDQLRDVSHIGIDRFTIEPEVGDLVTLAQRVVADVQTTATGHTIELDMRDAPLPVSFDEFRMEQVVNNLVGNAVKYSSEGGRVTVTVGRSRSVPPPRAQASVPPDWAVITVRDEGIGIPESSRARLFERFFRADNAKGKVSGMGLGLFISREIIQHHGGVIWVESEEGKGSLFGVALPPASEGATDELVDAEPNSLVVTGD